MTAVHYQGTLSLILHGARQLVNLHGSKLSPIATITSPHCNRCFTTTTSKLTHHQHDQATPTWNAEFDLCIDLDAGDRILVSVLNNPEERQVLGICTMTIQQYIEQSLHQHANDEEQGDVSQWYVLQHPQTEKEMGEVRMTITWSNQKKKGGAAASSTSSTPASTTSSTPSPSPSPLDPALGNTSIMSPNGRFLISDISESDDDEEDEDSANGTAHSSHSADATSSHSSINSHASTTDASDETLPSSDIINDRRSSSVTPPIDGTPTTSASAPSLSSPYAASTAQPPPSTRSTSLPSPTTNAKKPQHPNDFKDYSFPLPEDTYLAHQDRHVSSFIPSLTLHGTPALHSSGRHGLLYDDTTFFDDRNFLTTSASSTSICEIHVWSRDYIHGIQLVYYNHDSNQHIPGPKYIGKVHTTEHVLKLHHSDGEYIIGIEGTYKEWLETLTIITNQRSCTYGGNIDHRPIKWRPANKVLHPTSFKCDIPPGHRVVGFHGGYGVHIHNLGVIYQPISDLDTKKKRKCFFGELKRKLSNSKLSALPLVSP